MTEFIIDTFAPNIRKAAFKKKIYDTCTVYALCHYKKLSETHDVDRFPSNKFYKKIQNTKKDEEKSNDKKRVYPITFGKVAKTYIEFMISRFLWEISSIETSEEYPTSNTELKKFILDNLPKNLEYNVTEIIIKSSNCMNGFKINVSDDLKHDCISKFNEILNNMILSDLLASHFTDFLKCIILLITSRIWLEKSHSVNDKIIGCTIMQIELITGCSVFTFIKNEVEKININAKTTTKKATSKKTKEISKKDPVVDEDPPKKDPPKKDPPKKDPPKKDPPKKDLPKKDPPKKDPPKKDLPKKDPPKNNKSQFIPDNVDDSDVEDDLEGDNSD